MMRWNLLGAALCLLGAVPGCTIWTDMAVHRFSIDHNLERQLSAQHAVYDHLPPKKSRVRLNRWAYNTGPSPYIPYQAEFGSLPAQSPYVTVPSTTAPGGLPALPPSPGTGTAPHAWRDPSGPEAGATSSLPVPLDSPADLIPPVGPVPPVPGLRDADGAPLEDAAPPAQQNNANVLATSYAEQLALRSLGRSFETMDDDTLDASTVPLTAPLTATPPAVTAPSATDATMQSPAPRIGSAAHSTAKIAAPAVGVRRSPSPRAAWIFQ